MAAERARVEALWRAWGAASQGAPAPAPAAILLRALRKVYPSRDGNAAKVAVQASDQWLVRGLSRPGGATLLPVLVARVAVQFGIISQS